MFRFYLQVNNERSVLPSAEAIVVDYDPELDNILSLLHDLCEALEHSRRVVFRVEGFGQGPWPVDVATDLSVGLSELPGVAEWLRPGASGECEWWFFEQGIERKLIFSGEDDAVSVRCVSYASKWQPRPETEVVSRKSLRGMVRDLVRVFVDQSMIVGPELVAHEWFQEWLRSVDVGGATDSQNGRRVQA